MGILDQPEREKAFGSLFDLSLKTKVAEGPTCLVLRQFGDGLRVRPYEAKKRRIYSHSYGLDER